MDVYEALYTTRAMRRVRPDPIPEEVQRKILDAAIRAPSGGNSQTWRFLLVDDKAVLAQLGPIYRRCIAQVWELVYKDRLDAAAAAPDDPDPLRCHGAILVEPAPPAARDPDGTGPTVAARAVGGAQFTDPT